MESIILSVRHLPHIQDMYEVQVLSLSFHNNSWKTNRAGLISMTSPTHLLVKDKAGVKARAHTQLGTLNNNDRP